MPLILVAETEFPVGFESFDEKKKILELLFLANPQRCHFPPLLWIIDRRLTNYHQVLAIVFSPFFKARPKMLS